MRKTLIFCSVGESDAAQPLWHCEIKTVQSLGDNGQLETLEFHDMLKRAWKTLTFDEQSGLLHFGSGGTGEHLKVLVSGDDKNGTRALGDGTLEKRTILYIKTFVPQNPVFIYDGSEIITGVCTKI